MADWYGDDGDSGAAHYGEADDDDYSSDDDRPLTESPLGAAGGATSEGSGANPVASSSSAAAAAFAASSSLTPAKRPRGRPRKHPLLSPDAQARIAKGRSKTGCITCRRRKKKCDETKPQCMNCQKNAVVCEGYPQRVVWRSGKERAEEARAARAGTRPQEVPYLVDGFESATDKALLDYFELKAIKIGPHLPRHLERFKKTLLGMASRHRGLMHAVLCFGPSGLSASEFPSLAERGAYHYRRALEELRTDKKVDEAPLEGRVPEPMDDPTIASALIMCLDSIYDTEPDEDNFQPHVQAARFLIGTMEESPEQAFGEFLVEFFGAYRTRHASTMPSHVPATLLDHTNFTVPLLIIQREKEDRAFAGVFDGLYDIISKITQLREVVRARRAQEQIGPLAARPTAAAAAAAAATTPILTAAAASADDHAVTPATGPSNTHTTTTTNTSVTFTTTLDYTLLCDALTLDTSIRLWIGPSPRQDSPRYIAAQLYRQCAWIYLYRTVFPSRPSPKLAGAVEEGLAYLRQLPPDAACQSILLMPVFMLGVAAFAREHRPELRKAFGTMKRYSSLRHIEHAKDAVERLWAVMDAGDDRSWDWESVVAEGGRDFMLG